MEKSVIRHSSERIIIGFYAKVNSPALHIKLTICKGLGIFQNTVNRKEQRQHKFGTQEIREGALS
ncbi:MAG: hypothetical protein C4530_14240 [Desulfobacteraceae bacterium]|nr:MAG: hypothetical protein C4530_14240 [Desulfobacteraceae bacterium]